MPIVFSAILSWFSSLAGRYLVDVGLKFLAYKVLVYTLLTVTFPIVIKNLLVWLMEQVNSIIQSSLPSGDIASFSASLTGLAGWLGDQLMLPTCISIVLSAIAIRFVLNFIPFVG
jgi:hypothetical protein